MFNDSHNIERYILKELFECYFLFGTLILYITFVYMVVYKEVIYQVKVKYIPRGKNMERSRFCVVVG